MTIPSCCSGPMPPSQHLSCVYTSPGGTSCWPVARWHWRHEVFLWSVELRYKLCSITSDHIQNRLEKAHRWKSESQLETALSTFTWSKFDSAILPHAHTPSALKSWCRVVWMSGWCGKVMNKSLVHTLAESECEQCSEVIGHRSSGATLVISIRVP